MQRAVPCLMLSWGLAFGVSSELAGQDLEWMEQGDRVRVWTEVPSQSKVTGTFAGSKGDSLLISAAGPRWVIRQSVTRVDVSLGRSAGKGAWRGALVGFTAGAIVGGLTSSEEFAIWIFTVPMGTLLGVGGGALVGVEQWGQKWVRPE